MTNSTIIRDRIERVKRELETLENRRTRLVIEFDVLRDLLNEANGGDEEKVGPADAVRRIVGEHPGISRKEIVERAAPIVTTEAAKAHKTIAQTIRNLTDRHIRQDGDQFFPMNGNGHGN